MECCACSCGFYDSNFPYLSFYSKENKFRFVFLCNCSYHVGAVSGTVNTGLLVGLSGVMASSRFGAALPNQGLNFEMDVITAVVIGGTSIFGGVGNLGGTLLGVLIIGMISNGMLLLEVHSYWQQVAKGLILILAVGADTIKQIKED